MIGGNTNGELPEGWAAARLGEIADCRLGKMLDQAKNRGDPQPYLRNVNVQWGRIDLDDIKQMRIAATEEEQYAVLPGDLLVCEGGEPGRCAVWCDGREMYLQKALHRVRPRGDISAEYLRWWLQDAAATGRLSELFTGSTIKHLPGRQLARVDVALPPAAEQRRIATRLHAIDRHRAAVADHLRSARATLDRLRGAVLAAACSGRLTEDLRDDRTSADDFPTSWRRVTLDDLAESIRGGSGEVPVHAMTEYPVLRSSSVRPLSIDYDDVRYLSDKQSTRAANFVAEGDLLVTRLNGNVDYVGNAAVVEGLEDRRVQYPDRLFRIRLKDPSRAKFLQLFLASPRARAQVQAASRSAAGHQRISISDLRSFAIQVPPPDEEGEVVRRAEAALRAADRLVAQAGHIAVTVDRIASASLAKAFRGELVATEAATAEEEGRGYESAPALLARTKELAVAKRVQTSRVRRGAASPSR